MKKLLYLLSIVLLGAACSNSDKAEPNAGAPVPKNQFTKGKDIVSYYQQQIDKEKIGNPAEKMYREFIAAEEIQSVQEQMWHLWKEANKQQIEKSKLTYEDITQRGKSSYWEGIQYIGLETVWDIPQDERMKLKMFFKGEKPAGKYPMIINLHGGGEYPDVAGPWASTINSDEYSAIIEFSRYYQDSPAFYFVPRMPDDRKGNWHYVPEIIAFKRAIQIAMLSDIINPEKIYLTGISQGGYGTINLSQFMPDYFAAAGSLAAADAFDETAKNLRNIAFRMKVGGKDYDYGRVNHAYNWQEKLKQLQQENPNDYKGEVVIEQGKEHGEIDYYDMTPWMKNYMRRIYPEHITYVYYNIAPGKGKSGMYSNGVYYLDFRNLTHQTDNDKALFDVVHNGNTYDITVENISGKIEGKLSIYLDKIDFSKPVIVNLNGKRVHDKVLRPSRGVMAESIALWGDSLRIFAGKATIDIP